MATQIPRIQRVFGAVNIGSFRISAMVMGQTEDGRMIVLASSHRKSEGIKRGYVTDMAAATHAIRTAVVLHDGEEVTAAGVVFRVDDIARLDLRRWKLKGLAIATLKPECGGARIRLDGLTYGGFRKEDSPHNAEDFMKALLSLYRGEIVDYEEIPDAGGPPARQEDEERAV